MGRGGPAAGADNLRRRSPFCPPEGDRMGCIMYLVPLHCWGRDGPGWLAPAPCVGLRCGAAAAAVTVLVDAAYTHTSQDCCHITWRGITHTLHLLPALLYEFGGYSPGACGSARCCGPRMPCVEGVSGRR